MNSSAVAFAPVFRFSTPSVLAMPMLIGETFLPTQERASQATFSGLSFSYSARLASDVSQRSTACCMLSQN